MIVVGYPEPDSAFDDCRQQATIGNDAGADNEEAGRPIWICSGPRQPWSRTWPSLKRLRA